MGKVAILTGRSMVGREFARAMLREFPERIGFIEQITESAVVVNKADDLDVPNFCYTDEDMTLQRIAEHDVTTVVLAWWPNIVHKINKLGINVINTHPSYLPYNRGKFPYYWSIKDETPFGVSIHRVDNGIDTGGLLWQRRIDLTPLDTGETAYKKSHQAMQELLLDHVSEIAMEIFPTTYPQDESKATYHHSKEFDLPPIKNDNGAYDGYALINDCRARTFNNNHSGRRIEIDGKVYRIHLDLVEEDNEGR